MNTQRRFSSGLLFGGVEACDSSDAPIEGHVAHAWFLLDDGSAVLEDVADRTRARTVGWRVDCECGWHGPTYPAFGQTRPGGEQLDRMLGDWERDHADAVIQEASLPLVLQAVKRADQDVRGTLGNLRAALIEAETYGARFDQLVGALSSTDLTTWYVALLDLVNHSPEQPTHDGPSL